MATKSFLKNVVIKDPKLARQFVNTLSEAEEKVKSDKSKKVEISRPCVELKDDEIKIFFGVK